MGRKFAIRPRRYHDQQEAIADKLRVYQEKGHVIDIGLNPQGKMELLAWAWAEIERLRTKCGEEKIVKRSKVVVGPRPAGESRTVSVETEVV